MISGSVSITAPPLVSRSTPSTSRSRIGWAMAVPSAMVGWISVGTGVSAPARKAAAIGAQLAGWTAKMRGQGGDLAGALQFGKADLAAEHVGAGAARGDDVVGRAEAEVLPEFVGQRLGAVQEERVPVVAGVEDRLARGGPRRRRCPGGCRGSVPAWRRARASAPVLAGLVEAGAMMVACMPPAAA